MQSSASLAPIPSQTQVLFSLPCAPGSRLLALPLDSISSSSYLRDLTPSLFSARRTPYTDLHWACSLIPLKSTKRSFRGKVFPEHLIRETVSVFLGVCITPTTASTSCLPARPFAKDLCGSWAVLVCEPSFLTPRGGPGMKQVVKYS